MTTTPSPPLPQTCAPPSHPLRPPSVLQSGTRHQSPGQATPATGPEQPDLRPASLAPARSPSSQAYPSPLLQAHQHPSQPQPVLPQPGHRPASLTLPPSCLFTDTDISSVAYKTPCNFYREGTILPVFVPCLYLCQCLYLCHACICTTCRYKYPRHPLGAPGISVKDQSAHLMILVTRPEPTVRPPSRIAKPRPSSMAMGWIS